MSDLRERLKRLQRQAGHTAAMPAAPRPIRDQLRDLLARRTRRTRNLEPPGGDRLADGLYVVEQRHAAAPSPTLRFPWSDDDALDRERFVCFDTETTGLAGGVGTKAFMIGTAQWQRGEMITRQWYLTALAGEAPMLDAFSRALPDDAILVSYNGRSYDAPLLKGRYRIHRRTHPFDSRAHVDLLHPTRRAYRGVWENCRLITIERRLLGIDRGDDLPGAEAPGAWLSYLRGQDARPLARVLDHNRADVLTLATLLDHFGTRDP